jgi:hypothetical protein
MIRQQLFTKIVSFLSLLTNPAHCSRIDRHDTMTAFTDSRFDR